MELLTVGHGTLDADAFVALVAGAGVAGLVDVRRFPGSRRHPHFGAEPLAASLAAAGIGYRHDPDLGGRRRGRPDSPHVGLRHPSFRAYADHMETPAFRDALARLVAEAGATRTAVLCSESLWWRCHRRMIADAATLVHGATVVHLRHDGRLDAHVPTDVVRVVPAGLVPGVPGAQAPGLVPGVPGAQAPGLVPGVPGAQAPGLIYDGGAPPLPLGEADAGG